MLALSLLVVALLGAVAEDVDDATDLLLSSVRDYVVAEDCREFPLPPEVTLGPLSCQGGRLGDLGSLRRTGDVAVSSPNPNVTIEGSLGLANLTIGFQKCSLMHLPGGPVTLSFSQNSIYAKVELWPDEAVGCRGEVTNLTVAQFELDATKTKESGGVKTLLEEWALNVFKKYGLNKLVEKVWSLGNKALAEGKVCQLGPPRNPNHV